VKTGSRVHRCRALYAAAVLGALAFLPAAHAEDAPRIDALRVAKIATDYLASAGRNAPHIVSIALEKDALLRGKTSWVVRWSGPVFADGNKEVGMRVSLDGSVSYLIDEKHKPKKPVGR
jgi:hypothetical protein